MKNVKTLTLLSVSLILAACGKSGGKSSAITPSEPTSSEPTSSEIVSSNSGASSSESTPDTPTLETDPAKVEKILEEGSAALNKCVNLETAGKTSFTEKMVFHGTHFEEEKQFAPKSDTPSRVEYEKYANNADETYAYNAQDKTGYIAAYDDSSSGKMELSGLEWVEKNNNNYKRYYWNEGWINDVDDEYALRGLLAYIDTTGYYIEGLSTDLSVSIRIFEGSLSSGIKSDFDEGCYGEVSAIGSISAAYSKDAQGNNILSFKTSINSVYVAPELPETLHDEYLIDVQGYQDFAATLVFDNNGLKSISEHREEYLKLTTLAYYGRTEEVNIDTGDSKTTVERKYEPLKEHPDTSSFVDQGVLNASVRLILPNGDDMGYSIGQIGDSVSFTAATVVGTEAALAGVTYEIYKDPEYKEKLDISTVKVKSYEQMFYVKVIVPEDIVFVRYIAVGRWPEYYGTDYLAYNLVKSDVYVGEPKDNYCISAYTLTNRYDNDGVFYPTVTCAPTSAEVYYTDDEDVVIKNKKFIDLKAGHFYCIEYIADVVA
ncbi:MAG: hypothetical protein MJ220_02905 [Bacilli bacterium]|nr:hypothetical protein [Bacilli bacterium]